MCEYLQVGHSYVSPLAKHDLSTKSQTLLTMNISDLGVYLRPRDNLESTMNSLSAFFPFFLFFLSILGRDRGGHFSRGGLVLKSSSGAVLTIFAALRQVHQNWNVHEKTLNHV